MLQGRDLHLENPRPFPEFPAWRRKAPSRRCRLRYTPRPGELGLVHGNKAASQAIGCIDGDGPLGAVVCDYSHGVSPADHEPREPAAEIVHPPADLPVRRPFVHPSGDFVRTGVDPGTAPRCLPGTRQYCRVVLSVPSLPLYRFPPSVRGSLYLAFLPRSAAGHKRSGLRRIRHLAPGKDWPSACPA